MKVSDWILITVDYAKEEGLTPIQLQKTLFLIGQSLKLKDFYNFVPYSYGPFDSQIYSDAELLSIDGCINVTYNGRSYPHYKISVTGSERASEIKAKMEKKDTDFIEKTVEFVKSLSFKELLKAVYKSYPAYAVNSIFKEKI